MSTTRAHARARGMSALATVPDPGPSPPSTRTRTPIYETPCAYKDGILPLCAAPCCLIPSLVCDTKKDENRIRGETGGPASTPFWRHTLVRGSKPFLASWRLVDRMGRSSSYCKRCQVLKGVPSLCELTNCGIAVKTGPLRAAPEHDRPTIRRQGCAAGPFQAPGRGIGAGNAALGQVINLPQ